MRRSLLPASAVALIVGVELLAGCSTGGVPSGSRLTSEPPKNVEVTAKNGVIAFDADNSDAYRGVEIRTVTSDGSREVVVASDSNPAAEDIADFVHYVQPAWSPDGERIAFVSNAGGNAAIYTMAADGSDRVLVTADGVFPRWSPDGTRIAFTRFNGAYDLWADNDLAELGGDIWVTSASGGEATRLTQGSSSWSPDWSPDGSRIVFTSGRDGNDELYVMASGGTRQTRLTDDAGSDGAPRWSPDGQQIIFASNRGSSSDHYDIYVMAWDGSRLTNLTEGSDDSDQGAPAWSPDGRKIVFTSLTAGGNISDLFVADANGQNRSRLTITMFTADHPDWQPVTRTPVG